MNEGGLCYMKRVKYLDTPGYSALPQFVTGRSTFQGTMKIYESFDSQTPNNLIAEMSLSEFSKIYELD